MSILSDPPKYIVVKESILEGIRRDKLPARSRLAPIAKMSVHFGVSPSVIQRALNDLVSDGFVECRGPSGYYVRGDAGKKETESAGTEESRERTQPPLPPSGKTIPPVYLICSHHSDLVWRRTYEEAGEVRRAQTERLIEIAERNPEFHFYFEQTETPVRLPEFHTRLKALLKSGQAEIIGGMLIPDLNMISGETFLRSLLQGRADCRKFFGTAPETACLSDAFGMPIQVPQILTLCGYRYLLPGRCPNPPDSLNTDRPFRWIGANDTSVLVFNPVPILDIDHLTNVPVIYDPHTRIRNLLEALAGGLDHSFANFCKEEGLFEDDICRIAEQVNRGALREIRFGALRDLFDSLAEEEHPRYRGEFNPVFTGCYSTRIENKQLMRKAEILMRRAELLAAARERELPSEEMEKELFRAAFHDSLCGCCTDAAQRGIRKKLDSVLAFAEKQSAPPKAPGKTFFIANTSSVKGRQLVCSRTAPAGVVSEEIDGSCYFYADLPRIGGSAFSAGPAPKRAKKIKARSFKTKFFSIDLNNKYPRITSPLGDVFSDRFGALRIRPDFGSLWTERFKDAPLDDSCSQESSFTVLEGPLFFRAFCAGRIVPDRKTRLLYGHTDCPWNGFHSLSWKKEFLFPKDLDFFFLRLTLDFHGRNTKILVSFPHKLDPFQLTRTDSVPFGSISRKPYFEVDCRFESTMKQLRNSDYSSAMGDWPVLDWSDFADDRAALAIANSGTPGCWSAGNDVTFSLLRSGTAVEDGALVPDPGSFDNGVHEYLFAFRAHQPGELWKAAELGNILNRMPSESVPLPEGQWLSWDRDNIALSSAFRKDGRLILRFFEFAGRKCQVGFSGSWVDAGTLSEITPEGAFLRELPGNTAVFAPGEIKTLSIG